MGEGSGNPASASMSMKKPPYTTVNVNDLANSKRLQYTSISTANTSGIPSSLCNQSNQHHSCWWPGDKRCQQLIGSLTSASLFFCWCLTPATCRKYSPGPRHLKSQIWRIKIKIHNDQYNRKQQHIPVLVSSPVLWFKFWHTEAWAKHSTFSSAFWIMIIFPFLFKF